MQFEISWVHINIALNELCINSFTAEVTNNQKHDMAAVSILHAQCNIIFSQILEKNLINSLLSTVNVTPVM